MGHGVDASVPSSCCFVLEKTATQVGSPSRLPFLLRTAHQFFLTPKRRRLSSERPIDQRPSDEVFYPS